MHDLHVCVVLRSCCSTWFDSGTVSTSPATVSMTLDTVGIMMTTAPPAVRVPRLYCSSVVLFALNMSTSACMLGCDLTDGSHLRYLNSAHGTASHSRVQRPGSFISDLAIRAAAFVAYMHSERQFGCCHTCWHNYCCGFRCVLLSSLRACFRTLRWSFLLLQHLERLFSMGSA